MGTLSWLANQRARSDACIRWAPTVVIGLTVLFAALAIRDWQTEFFGAWTTRALAAEAILTVAAAGTIVLYRFERRLWAIGSLWLLGALLFTAAGILTHPRIAYDLAQRRVWSRSVEIDRYAQKQRGEFCGNEACEIPDPPERAKARWQALRTEMYARELELRAAQTRLDGAAPFSPSGALWLAGFVFGTKATTIYLRALRRSHSVAVDSG